MTNTDKLLAMIQEGTRFSHRNDPQRCYLFWDAETEQICCQDTRDPCVWHFTLADFYEHVGEVYPPVIPDLIEIPGHGPIKVAGPSFGGLNIHSISEIDNERSMHHGVIRIGHKKAEIAAEAYNAAAAVFKRDAEQSGQKP